MSLLSQDKEFLQSFLDVTCMIINYSMQIIDQDRLCIAAAGAEQVKNCIGKYSREDGAIARLYLKKLTNSIIVEPGQDDNCIGCSSYHSCPRSLYHCAVFGPIVVNGEIVGIVGAMANDEKAHVLMAENKETIYRFMESIASLISHRIEEREKARKIENLTSLLSKTISSIPQGIIVLDEKHHIKMQNALIRNRLGDEAAAFQGKHISALFKRLDDDYFAFHLKDQRFHELNYKKLHFTAEFASIPDGSAQDTLIFLDENVSAYNRAWQFTNSSRDITFEDILGEDENFMSFKRAVRSVAPYDSTILLIGETGVGKEMFARAIHNASPRSKGPFVAVNCGAIPETLIESELFGYEKGAFTGASAQGKHGKFFLANGGTLFLDELENTPLFMQQKLLRVLESGEVERVGGTQGIKVDVRIVAASNGKLDEMAKEGTFRKDLFHRLSVLPFLIPPLRERGNDILILANYYLRKYNTRYQKRVESFDDDMTAFLLSYEWEGNVRELQNTIEYAVCMCEENTLRTTYLPFNIKKEQLVAEKPNPFRTLREMELSYIKKVVDFTGFDEKGRKEAAAILGIGQATIYRRLAEIRNST